MATRLSDGSIKLRDGRVVFANSLVQAQDLLEILELVVPGYIPAPLWPFVSGGGGGGGGAAGVIGADGADGADGAQGNQGFQGPGTGTPGAQGSQGPQGVDGANGAQGFQGAVGAGVQGAQGNQGVDGTNGVQGSQGFQGALNPDIYAATRVVSLIAGEGTDLTIAAAITALPAEGGLIFVKQGTYSIAATLTLPDKNVVIRGAGEGTVISLGANAIPAFTIPTGLTVERTYTFEDFKILGTAVASQRGWSVQDANSRGVVHINRVDTEEVQFPIEVTDGGNPVLIDATDCHFQQLADSSSILIVNSPGFPAVNLVLRLVRFYRVFQDSVVGTISQGGHFADFTNVNVIAQDSQFSIGSVDCTVGALALVNCYLYNFAPIPNVRVCVADDSAVAISSAVVGCNMSFVDFELAGTGTKFDSCRFDACSFRDTAISSFTDCYFVGIGTAPATAVLDCVGDTIVNGCYFQDDAVGSSYVISDPSVVADCTIYGLAPVAAIHLLTSTSEVVGNFIAATVPILETGVAATTENVISGNRFDGGPPTLLAGSETLLDDKNIRTFSTTPITLDQLHRTVLSDATGGARVINLPSAASAVQRSYTIKKVDASANTVTIDAAGAETIDGATTQVLTTQWQSVTIQSNGTSWSII